MDAVNKRIVAALEADGRMSFAELAGRAGLSKTPCWNRVRDMEETGVITGYKALVDPARIGLGVQAFVHVTVDFGKSADFERGVLAHPSVLACHATTGDADYLLHVAAQSIGALDTLLRRDLPHLPGVQRFATSVAMRAIKTDAPLSAAAGLPGDGAG